LLDEIVHLLRPASPHCGGPTGIRAMALWGTRRRQRVVLDAGHRIWRAANDGRGRHASRRREPGRSVWVGPTARCGHHTAWHPRRRFVAAPTLDRARRTRVAVALEQPLRSWISTAARCASAICCAAASRLASSLAAGVPTLVSRSSSFTSGSICSNPSAGDARSRKQSRRTRSRPTYASSCLARGPGSRGVFWGAQAGWRSSCSTARRIQDDTERSSAAAAARTCSSSSGDLHVGGDPRVGNTRSDRSYAGSSARNSYGLGVQ